MKTIGISRKRRISINLQEIRVYINHILWQKSTILTGRPWDFLPFFLLSSLLPLLAPAFVVVDSSLVVLFFSDVSVVVVGDKVEAAVVASAKDERLV